MTRPQKFVIMPGHLGPFKSLTRARNKADRLDNEYGAYRYTVHGLCDKCGALCAVYRPVCDKCEEGT